MTETRSLRAHIEVQRRIGRTLASLAAILALNGLFLAVTLSAVSANAQTLHAREESVSSVASIGITVSDLDRLTDFYVHVLGFEKMSEVESAGATVEHLTGTFGVRRRSASLRLGDEILELTQYLAPEGRPIPTDSRSHDRWFQHIAIVVSDIDKAYAHLRGHNIRHASSGPQTLPDWNTSAGGISAFYFKDPDGHVLEVIQLPPGKGDPKWQTSGDKLFLGIDHTAIVVADTDRSLTFYRGVLGMRVAGTSENYGTEQEHLNNVFGARLRITALRAPRGPGIELLEYLTPTDGRDYPTDARASDLVSWTTQLTASTPSNLANQITRSRSARWISPGLVDNLDAATSWSQAMSLRDPDGHVLVIGRTADRGESAAAR